MLLDRVLKRAWFLIVNRSILFINRASIGRGLRPYGYLFIKNSGLLEIGSNFTFNSGNSFNPIGGDTVLRIIVMKTGKVIIGNHCGISNSALFCFQEIQIGNYVMIGGGCKIYDSDFHSLIFENRTSALDTDIKSRAVSIKEGAFIGAHSIILKGTIVGKKSIIGAGSVVSGVIPDGEVWAGNPAKFIRKV